jgi:hypothetical protein
MQPETIITEEKSPLFRVTSVSKYLAMILFIALPFVGGFVGYSLDKTDHTAINTSTLLTTPIIDTTSAVIDAPRIQLLSEKTTIDDSQNDPGLNIYHRETIAIPSFSDSPEYIKFDIGSIQSLYINSETTKQEIESAVFASRLDYNQHLKFNEQTNEWYLDGVAGSFTTTLFRVYKLEPQEDVISRITAIHKTDSPLTEGERNILIQLAQQFPDKDERYFLNRDFCQIEEKFDGTTGYISTVRPEYREAVDALGQHPGIFCSKPSIIKLDNVLIENYAFPIDAAEPKAFNFQPVKEEELSGN